MSLRTAFAISALAVAAVCAHADTITLDTANSSGGTYRYTYTTSGVKFSPGGSFTFTGLSGVTGASSQIPSFYTATFTSTSVSFTVPVSSGAGAGPYTDLFTITSNVLTLGAVQYSIPTTPAQTGTVLGPVAAVAVTPEPSSLLLLGTGMLGMLGAACRRFV